MKTSNFIIACTVGIFTYFLLFGVMGENGLLALRQKQDYLVQLRSHLIELEYHQNNLANRVLAMESSQERINQEMNRIGFIQDHQIIIRLPHVQPIPRRMSPGTRISLPLYIAPNNGILLSLGLAAGMITFLFLVLGDGLVNKKVLHPSKKSQSYKIGADESHSQVQHGATHQEHSLASNS
jgi:hypothetical protein